MNVGKISNMDRSYPPSRETLAALAQRHTRDEIAALYGVSGPAVTKLAQRLGIVWPSRSERKQLTREEIVALAERGETLRSAAAHFGVAMSSLQRWIAKYGIQWPPKNRRRLSAAQEAQREIMRQSNAVCFRKPILAKGEKEEVADYLARGGTITKLPPAYAAPIVSGTPAHGRHGGRVV